MLYDKKWDQKLPQVDDVGQVLLDAADMIEERGWTQDWFQGPKGEICTLKAVTDITGWGAPRFIDATQRLRAYIKTDKIVLWNDQDGQTKEKVVTALRAAAYAV